MKSIGQLMDDIAIQKGFGSWHQMYTASGKDYILNRMREACDSFEAQFSQSPVPVNEHFINEQYVFPKKIWANIYNSIKPNSWDLHLTEASAVINASPSTKTHCYIHESKLTNSEPAIQVNEQLRGALEKIKELSKGRISNYAYEIDKIVNEALASANVQQPAFSMIDWLKEHLKDENNRKEAKEFFDSLSNTQQPEAVKSGDREWVSVRDMLPKGADIVYLVCVKNKNKENGIPLIDLAVYDNDGIWQKSTVWEDVTHWMLLPDAPEALANAANKPQTRDWEEDFSHENGNYFCICGQCGNQFKGHKRRVVCYVCANKPDNENLKEGE